MIEPKGHAPPSERAKGPRCRLDARSEGARDRATRKALSEPKGRGALASERKGAAPTGRRSEGARDRATREGGALKRPEASERGYSVTAGQGYRPAVPAVRHPVAAQPGLADRRVLDPDPVPGPVHAAAEARGRAGGPVQRAGGRPVPAGDPVAAGLRQRDRARLQHDLRAEGGRDRALPGHPGQPAGHPDRPDPGHHDDDVRVRRGRRRGRLRGRVLGALGRAGGAGRAARPAHDHRGRVLGRHRADHEGHQRLRRDRQRPQPAGPAAGRGAAADLARPGLDAGDRALQPAVLPGRGVPRAGRRHAGRHGGRPGLRRARAAVRCWCWPGRPACSARRSRNARRHLRPAPRGR